MGNLREHTLTFPFLLYFQWKDWVNQIKMSISQYLYTPKRILQKVSDKR